MSKFSTVPIWYDKNGRLNQMLTGDARSTIGPENISIGVNSSAGAANGLGGSVAVGYDAHGNGTDAIAIGALASAEGGSIAIGRSIAASGGGIGIGGNASANQIQLGNKGTKYDLTVGNGTGTINGMAFEIVPVNDDNSVDVTEGGIYLCCLSREDTVAGQSVLTNNIAIIYIQPFGTNIGVTLSSQDNVCDYSSSSKKITGKDNNSILKCLKVIL